MRAVVTRVKNASVVINEQVNGQIGLGRAGEAGAAGGGIGVQGELGHHQQAAAHLPAKKRGMRRAADVNELHGSAAAEAGSEEQARRR